jgi:shikimate dehydrogenase
MKKFLVIGNPIDHSLSPNLHNFWIKENNLNAEYQKKKLNENELKNLVNDIKNDKIAGANVTTPFKSLIIPFIDELTEIAKKTNSVNTLYKKSGKIIGDNTDAIGFQKALEHINYSVLKKKILLLGAGGVAPSIIFSLEKMGAGSISLSNRTRDNALRIKNYFPKINIINWGEMIEFDMIINLTSLGLLKDDKIDLNLNEDLSNKLFYDIIYNPAKTNFLLSGKKNRAKVENGKLMFMYQAQKAFEIWHNIKPTINKNSMETMPDD